MASKNGSAGRGRFESNWGFGVHTHEDDAQAIHGYYVQWSDRDTEWDYFPGGNEPILPPDGRRPLVATRQAERGARRQTRPQ